MAINLDFLSGSVGDAGGVTSASRSTWRIEVSFGLVLSWGFVGDRFVMDPDRSLSLQFRAFLSGRERRLCTAGKVYEL